MLSCQEAKLGLSFVVLLRTFLRSVCCDPHSRFGYGESNKIWDVG